MIPPPIRLEELTLAHGRRVAVEALSGCLASGSLTAVVGPNGGGKTTLLRAIAGLHRPSAGRINFGGAVRPAISLLPQAGSFDRTFPITCFEVVALGHWRRAGAFRALGRRECEGAGTALAAVGLAGFETRPVAELSAGQFQRVQFARILVEDAPVLLLDEPFNAVDEPTERDLMALVVARHSEGRTVVAVLHDLTLVRAAFPQTLLLARCQVAWGATPQALAAANLRRARFAVDAWAEKPPEFGRSAA